MNFTQQQNRPSELPILKPYGPPFTGLHPYLAWGWFNQGARVPPYFRPYYVEYETPNIQKNHHISKTVLITGILEEVVYNKRGNNRSRRQVGA
jgi:hypothetical protein